MTEQKTKRSQKTGLPPGSPVYIGSSKSSKVKISVTYYNEQHFEEKQLSSADECFRYKGRDTISWINIDGVHDTEILRKVSECYGIHPLVQEDIANTGQRPKIEDYGDYLYIVLRMLSYDEKASNIRSEQVSIILGNDHVISFQEEGKEGDVFGQVRERLRSGKTKIRKEGSDYLCYCLIDEIVDSYFAIMEKLGERIEGVEEKLIANPTQKILNLIHQLKKETLSLRKSVWPLREVVNSMERGESPLIREGTRLYLRDVYDHTVEVIETVENYREMMSGMVDIYLSGISNKLNEVMKVLTIISTTFIPLTFIVGIYGMNFKNMPEMQWQYSYAAVWIVMLCVAGSMLVYFKKKKWL